ASRRGRDREQRAGQGQEPDQGRTVACRAMRALVSKQSAPFAELADVPDPTARRDEALVEVHAISLNRGETRRLEQLEPGPVTGWDLAGTVRQPAGDGGPSAGDRVVGVKNAGAWAELAAVKL